MPSRMERDLRYGPENTLLQGCCLRKFFRSPSHFFGAQDKFDMVNGGGGGVVGEIGKDRGEGGVNCGNIGEGSWVRDFP